MQNENFWAGIQTLNNQATKNPIGATSYRACVDAGMNAPVQDCTKTENKKHVETTVKGPTRLHSLLTASEPVKQTTSVRTLKVGQALRVGLHVTGSIGNSARLGVAAAQLIVYKMAEAVFIVFDEKMGAGSVHYSHVTVPGWALDGELLPAGTTLSFTI